MFPSINRPKPSTPSSENELHKHDDGLIETKVDPPTEELAQRPAKCRALEETQSAELTLCFRANSRIPPFRPTVERY